MWERVVQKKILKVSVLYMGFGV